MNEWEEAKRRCEKIIELRPNYAEAYNNLAILYDKKNDYANALKNYAQAVNLQPDYVKAHYNLGLFFLKHQKLNEALKQFNNVVEIDPGVFMAHYYLGNLYLERNQLDLAEKHYSEALSLNPEHSDTLSNLGVVYLKKDKPQTAVDYFTKALAFDIHHQDSRNNLAATFMQYDRYENAARHYHELLKVEPDNEEYHYNIAVAYMNLGHLNEAVIHFEQVLEKNLFHAASCNNLAAVYWRLENKEKAQEYLSKALKINPENKVTLYMFAALNHKKHQNSTFEQGAPAEYVKNLFDNYAVQYDAHLCQQLQYQLPEEINKLLSDNIQKSEADVLNVLDLGCGTGLLGQYLKQYYHSLIGVDLSGKMLKNAEKTGFYEKLHEDEIIHFLQNTSEKFDAIIAAEVFEYFGDLNLVFQEVSVHLKSKGIFIFSIEITQKKDFILQETARFAHNPEYIQALAKKYHLSMIKQIATTARLQDHQPLSSCLFMLKSLSQKLTC